MQMEWDEEKCQANLAKHGLSFEDAWQVLVGDTVTIPDKRHDYGEDRLITLGTLAGRVVVVVHVEREEKTRIISMRKANAREQEIYQERLRQD
ncbi:MAG: BrnT family toxin [Deltaproteobacteria bacterium]|nr:MAG: BrnT family toxin [Deltaproteobacteria bacterium]